MKRWVGLGVRADNLINIGKVLAVANAWLPNPGAMHRPGQAAPNGRKTSTKNASNALPRPNADQKTLFCDGK